MAVTLIVDDLVQPVGELDSDLFPNGDIDAFVIAWLLQAVTKVEANTGITAANHNAAATAWVYYRAYTQVADRFANSPSTIIVDGTVTRTTAADQRKYFADKATYWLDWYYGLNTLVPAITVPTFFGTVSARRPYDCTPLG